MLKIYNKNAITRQQRFNNAVVVGVGTSLLCVLASILLINYVDFYPTILFLAIRYGIGYAIQKFGRGVQKHFSYLAAGLAAVTILIIELYMSGGINGFFYRISIGGFSSLWEIAYIIGNTLPKYMIPVVYHHLPELKRNTNGKIDRLYYSKLVEE